MSNKFENLDAWKWAKKLVIFTYTLTDKYPAKENFCLVSQTTRAAVSVAANIAEGCSRSSTRDFSHFLEIAIGSIFELETLLIIGFERKYICANDYLQIKNVLENTIRLTFGLKRKINE